MAGPPTGHGPAHRLAPLGGDRPGLDHRLPRDVRPARLRAPGRRHGARHVPQPGRGHRVAARHGRRRHRRRGGARVHAVRPAEAAVRGLPLRPPAPVRRDRSRARPPVAGRDLVRRPARQRLLVDDVGPGHRLAPRVPGRRADPPQPAPPLPGGRRGPGVRGRRLGPRHRPRPRPLPRAGGPVLHLAVPRPLRLVAGEPVLAVRGPRRADPAPDGEGRRRRRAPGCARSRSGRASSSRGRTARSPRCTRARPRRCSSPAASASRRSGLCWRRSPARRS